MFAARELTAGVERKGYSIAWHGHDDRRPRRRQLAAGTLKVKVHADSATCRGRQGGGRRVGNYFHRNRFCLARPAAPLIMTLPRSPLIPISAPTRPSPP